MRYYGRTGSIVTVLIVMRGGFAACDMTTWALCDAIGSIYTVSVMEKNFQQNQTRYQRVPIWAWLTGLLLTIFLVITGLREKGWMWFHSEPEIAEVVRADGFSAPGLVRAARSQIGVTHSYDPSYVVLRYPNGDVPLSTGVCAEVVVRAMRTQGVDLQRVLHEDMSRAFAVYPKRWGLSRPDRNIDHRRVLNLEVYMQRKGKSLLLTRRAQDFQAGDWVTWRVGDEQLPHIGIVSNRKNPQGVPLIIHNIGAGTQEQDVLFAFPMSGHYRW